MAAGLRLRAGVATLGDGGALEPAGVHASSVRGEIVEEPEIGAAGCGAGGCDCPERTVRGGDDAPDREECTVHP